MCFIGVLGHVIQNASRSVLGQSYEMLIFISLFPEKVSYSLPEDLLAPIFSVFLEDPQTWPFFIKNMLLKYPYLSNFNFQ